MILYHGTNVDFDLIDLTKSHRFKDFGQGFYLTTIKKQAIELSVKKTLRDGGTPIVQEYEFDELHLNDDGLNILIFESPTTEWAEFIYKNRNRNEPFFTHNYDIVIGPIADDGVAYLLNRYEEGSFSLEDLARELKYKNLNDQYYFGTNKAISLLKRIK